MLIGVNVGFVKNMMTQLIYSLEMEAKNGKEMMRHITGHVCVDSNNLTGRDFMDIAKHGEKSRKPDDFCLFCGAEIGNVIYSGDTQTPVYKCGTYWDLQSWCRTVTCKDRQLAALKSLVREMDVLLNYAGQTLTVMATFHGRGKDEHLQAIVEIINRPEVKAIREGE